LFDTITDPLGSKRGSTDAKEGGFRLACNAFANQSFASPWRTKKKQTLGWTSQSSENVSGLKEELAICYVTQTTLTVAA
jgi:hypothetical protein